MDKYFWENLKILLKNVGEIYSSLFIDKYLWEPSKTIYIQEFFRLWHLLLSVTKGEKEQRRKHCATWKMHPVSSNQ